MEETGVVIEPEDIIGIRINEKDWYLAYRGRYISGEARSDNNENSEVVWLDVNEALTRSDVPSLTKSLIGCALKSGRGLMQLPYEASIKHDIGLLYGID